MITMSKLNSLNDLLIHEIQDLYDAEQQIVESLPLLADAADNEELKAAFREHTEQSREQVKRLEQACEMLDIQPGGVSCKAMQGLIEEAQEVLDSEAESLVKDAALIACAQKVEHYEMAGYGCARTYATYLGMNDIAELLQITLDEEMDTDDKLSEISEGSILLETAEGYESMNQTGLNEHSMQNGSQQGFLQEQAGEVPSGTPRD
jgi:ferritin-like metal-binding protein YciE